MNAKIRKSALVVSLTVIALFVFGAFQVFASFSDDSPRGFRSSTAISTSSDDSGRHNEMQNGEDTSFTGKIEAINGTVFTINGMAVTVDANTRLDSGLAVGVEVKVEVVKQSDGSLLAKEIETSIENEQETELDDVGDDHGNDLNMNDDHGNNAQMSDDHGVQNSTIDDHGNDAPKVDDRGGNSGSQVDDHGGNSGKGRN